MKSVNLPAGSHRDSDVGLLWEEITAPGVASTPAPFEVKVQGSVRVHAVTVMAIEIAGIPAVTLAAGETVTLNVGTGAPDDKKTTVTFEVTLGTGYVSRAVEIERGRRSK
jgi:hypothetical protein